MSTEERLQSRGRFTGGAGSGPFDFIYEDLSTEIDKRGTPWDFPRVDGTYIQEERPSGRTFPLLCIFSGPDCDLEAKRFERALLEPGVGSLEHPLDGKFDVVALGKIRRTDAVKSALNQSTVEVTLWHTIMPGPSISVDLAIVVRQSIEQFNLRGPRQFKNRMKLDTVTSVSREIGAFRAGLASVTRATRAIAAQQSTVARAMSNSQNTINSTINTLVSRPAALAFSAVQLAQMPGYIATRAADRVLAYGDMLAGIFSMSNVNRPNASSFPQIPLEQNDFFNADLFAMSAVSGSVVTSISSDYATRQEAVRIAAAIAAQYDTLVAWRDSRITELGIVDDGDGFQAIQNCAFSSIRYLIDLSFSLAPERTLVLDRDRNLLELCAELYGQVDERLDFFIQTNNLTGSEILVLPAGREVVFYE